MVVSRMRLEKISYQYFDNKTFERMNKEYGKEKMRTNLADYIATERPVFPLKEITKDRMRECFHSLQKFDTSTICIPMSK